YGQTAKPTSVTPPAKNRGQPCPGLRNRIPGPRIQRKENHEIQQPGHPHDSQDQNPCKVRAGTTTQNRLTPNRGRHPTHSQMCPASAIACPVHACGCKAARRRAPPGREEVEHGRTRNQRSPRRRCDERNQHTNDRGFATSPPPTRPAHSPLRDRMKEVP
ncbi:hypothetical protein OV450_8408, partial [Actinobacteria bacterium OV450]